MRIKPCQLTINTNKQFIDRQLGQNISFKGQYRYVRSLQKEMTDAQYIEAALKQKRFDDIKQEALKVRLPLDSFLTRIISELSEDDDARMPDAISMKEEIITNIKLYMKTDKNAKQIFKESRKKYMDKREYNFMAKIMCPENPDRFGALVAYLPPIAINYETELNLLKIADYQKQEVALKK